MTVFGMRNMPEDHALSRVYRFGGGLIGAVLLVFGVLGFFDQLAFFDIEGDRVAGLSTNSVLSTISVVVGAVLLVGAVVGGNTAANANSIVGALFLISGFANMCVLRTSWNVLNFSMANVIFSFVVGILLLMFGFYGRVSGGSPAYNPYYRAGPRQATGEATGEVVGEEAAAAGAGRGEDTGRRADDQGADPRR